MFRRVTVRDVILAIEGSDREKAALLRELLRKPFLNKITKTEAKNLASHLEHKPPPPRSRRIGT